MAGVGLGLALPSVFGMLVLTGLEGRMAAFVVAALLGVGVIGAWVLRSLHAITEARREEERRSGAPPEVLDALEELQIRLAALSERLARVEGRLPTEDRPDADPVPREYLVGEGEPRP